jgi:hypothetical protein
MEEYEVDVVDFMKLDIEWNELAALYGAQQALQVQRIKTLTFVIPLPKHQLPYLFS